MPRVKARKKPDLWIKVRSDKGEAKLRHAETGKTKRDFGRRPRTWKGVTVNPLLKPPSFRDTPWIEETECEACGERYREFNSHVSWSDAEDMLKGEDKFKSRGPILWAMRVLKLQRWQMRHFPCGDFWPARLGGALPIDKPLPQAAVYLCRFGTGDDDCDPANKLIDSIQNGQVDPALWERESQRAVYILSLERGDTDIPF